MLTNYQILASAKALIADPSTWCKGTRARNAKGKEVNPLSRTAVSFCSKGALLKVMGLEESNDRMAVLERMLCKSAGEVRQIGSELNYSGFNELRTHAEVMQMWDGAIEAAARIAEKS